MHIVHQKSVEEEKKEHVEKAGDLLKWVSNITKSLGKGGGEKSEKADSPKKQVLKHCLRVDGTRCMAQCCFVLFLASFKVPNVAQEHFIVFSLYFTQRKPIELPGPKLVTPININGSALSRAGIGYNLYFKVLKNKYNYILVFLFKFTRLHNCYMGVFSWKTTFKTKRRNIVWTIIFPTYDGKW